MIVIAVGYLESNGPLLVSPSGEAGIAIRLAYLAQQVLRWDESTPLPRPINAPAIASTRPSGIRQLSADKFAI
ncbi:MAG: hypothetical protein J0H34_07100 [Rhizobiales bacterium]|nr:hypothetical protein [Hyphomicrobiales bacterium]